MSYKTRDIIYISTVARYFIEKGTNMIPRVIIGNSEPEWLQEYYENFNSYDRYIYDTFYSWYTSVYLSSGIEHEAEQYVSELFANFIRLNNWKYQKIFNAMKIKYEPLENYRRNEKITETYTPNLTTEDTKIASFSDISESSNNRNETASSSATIGANTSNTTATYGNETTTNKVSPYDSENSYNRDISEHSKNNDTTQVNNSERTDSGNTQNNITETLNNEHTISDNTKNTNVKSGNSVNVHENLTYGNIGVTTSQQMLEEEFKVANHSFLNDFFMDMIKNTCIDFDW